MNDYFDRVERQILRSVAARASKRRRLRIRSLAAPASKRRWRSPIRVAHVVPALSILVAVAVATVFLSVGATHGTGPGAHGAGTGGGTIHLRYAAEPTAQTPVVTPAAIARAVAVIDARIGSLHLRGASARAGADHSIIVSLPAGRALAQTEQELGTATQLELYDWETNVLVPPTGATTASLLRAAAGDAGAASDALTISQGSGSAAPGSSSAAAGGLGLYQAVELAARQPAAPSARNARYADEYFLFGAPGSAACATAAADVGTAPVRGVHCLLDDPPVTAPADAQPARVKSALEATLPPGVTLSETQVLVVKQGTVVLQGSPQSFARWPAWGSPDARYYVVHDDAALFGNEIGNARESIGADGAPDVSLTFTSRGETAFRKLTAAVARRGELDSVEPNASLNQHFAIVIDDQLVTVPYVDFKQYPDGVSGASTDISGGFTVGGARALASRLRLGELPVRLALVSEYQSGGR